MLNFLRRDLRKIPHSALKTWTLASATLPWILPAFFGLLLAGAAASLGDSFTGSLLDFVVDITEDWLHLTGRLWLIAFFMAVVCYGVGRQLIGLTVRRSLCAPLADLAARLRRLPRLLLGIFAALSLAPASLPTGRVSTDYPGDSTPLTPPVALLAGAAPLLE